MSYTRVAAVTLLSLIALGDSLKCWNCGQYSDGVGSITPCPNKSATHLVDCPSGTNYCIKYVSELTVVRDCVPTCHEKEWWGARTFCCDTDECNAASTPSGSHAAALFTAILLAFFTR